MGYAAVCDAIIDRTRKNIGEVAVTYAKESGINLSEDGTVTNAGPADVKNLVESYKEIMGPGAIGHARQAIEELHKEDKSVEKLELPEEILPSDIKAEKFASAL